LHLLLPLLVLLQRLQQEVARILALRQKQATKAC
jgi:hypothetical protein